MQNLILLSIKWLFFVFGDSHASDIHSGWKIIPNIKCIHLPGLLCYTFGKYNLEKLNIEKHNVQNNDTVCFCFGEIDCRNHVHKHITKEKTYQIIIDEIIDNYFNAISINIKQYSKLNVCVYNVVPPGRKKNLGPNHNYPYLGTDDERKQYYLYFNNQLKKKCLENN